MTKKEIIEKINLLSDNSEIEFSTGDVKLSNRFDYSDTSYLKDEDSLTSISMTLFSWVFKAIVGKGQNKEKRNRIYKAFEDRFNFLVSQQKINIAFDYSLERDKALKLINDFFFTGENVSLPSMLATFSPLAIAAEILKGKEKDKKIIKMFKKQKEILFNQTVLFTRSLYHSFLCKKDMIQDNIKVDLINFDNSIILYDEREFIIPTWQNGYNLNSYKKLLLYGLNQINDNFSISNVDSLAIIYLSKDIYAKVNITE